MFGWETFGSNLLASTMAQICERRVLGKFHLLIEELKHIRPHRDVFQYVGGAIWMYCTLQVSVLHLSFASLCHTTQQRIRLSAVVVDVDGRNIRSTRLSWLVNEFWRVEIQKNQSWPEKEKCCFCSACYSHSVGKCSPHAQSALWKKIICTRKITNPLCNCTSIRIININQTQSSVPALYKFPFMGRSWPL